MIVLEAWTRSLPRFFFSAAKALSVFSASAKAVGRDESADVDKDDQCSASNYEY